MNEFIKKFKIDKLTIKELDYWTVSLRPAQATIGSLVLSLNRACSTMGEMTKEETEEMAEAFKYIEDKLKDKFNPDKINYLALMMVDEQVHFHVIPRYENVIVFESIKFVDAAWPKPPILNPIIIDEIVLKKIYNTLKNQ